MNYKHLFGIGVLAVIVIVGIHAVVVQQARREVARDSRISEAVLVMNQAVETTYADSGELPETQADIVLMDESRDIVSDSDLSYTKTGARAYTICATFNQASDGLSTNYSPLSFPLLESYSLSGSSDVDPFEHAAGEECFEYSSSNSGYDNFNFEPRSSNTDQPAPGFDDFESFLDTSDQNFEFR